MKRSLPNASGNSVNAKSQRPNDDEDEDVDDGLDDFNDPNFDEPAEEEDVIGLVHDTEEFKKWSRPVLDQIDTKNDSIIFQQIDIEHYVKKLSENKDEESIFRMYGINKKGNSIMAHIYGFNPYLYIKAPANFREEECENFGLILNAHFRTSNQHCQKFTKPLVRVEYCKKADIYGYKQNKIPFLRLVIATQSIMSAIKNMLMQGVEYKGSDCYFEVFDGSIDFSVRYMVDSGLVGCSWVELKPGTYQIRSDENKVSLCQLEVEINWKDIIYHNTENEWSEIAPLRVLSFDIECAGRKGIFPEFNIDPVIQISNLIVRYGEEEPFIKNIFTLKSCAPIVGAHVLCFDNEKKLLETWSKFIREVDPDIITGYNTQNFDIPYLMNRSKHLSVPNFHFLGRMRKIPSIVRDAARSLSKQMGARENKNTNIPGRIQYDLLQVLLREQKLRSYTLNAVSYHFLEEQKEDVAYQIITDLQNGDENTRRRLAIYCLKDAHLVLRLMKKLMCVVNSVEMARVTGIPLSYLLSRGQQVKVMSQMLRKAAQDDFVFPEKSRGSGDSGFEGATVIEPKRGFYARPIATLDFASLYPSIMMAHNLCYTTYLPGGQQEAERYGLSISEDVVKTPCNCWFVKSNIRRGLLPEILVQLIQARKKAKRDLANETDPFRRQVLDGRQLALKISANSVYGFTGAQNGALPCIAISSSVTAYGRQMINETKQVVETEFANINAEVIYGDTDSVMVNFRVDTVAQAMEYGKKAAELISARFIDPIKLEFEKVYFPYLLINKKRYAGMYYTRPDRHDKMDCKGLETVRRDNCPLAANLLQSCLKKLLLDRNEQAALKHAQQTISDLLCNRIDISQLIISKELTQSNYTSAQPHTRVAAKMKKRDPGSAPQLGDRVPYVITTVGSSKQTSERAEDPIYVLENSVPIDTDYYLKNQLTKPLLRIFSPIFGESKAQEKLLRGEHVLAKAQQSSKVGAMSKFTVTIPTCQGCRSKLKPGYKSFCEHCRPYGAELYRKELITRSTLEEQFGRLWSECQRCSGSVHQEVLCTSKDCPIFYMRKKVQQDLMSQEKVVMRLEEDLVDW